MLFKFYCKILINYFQECIIKLVIRGERGMRVKLRVESNAHVFKVLLVVLLITTSLIVALMLTSCDGTEQTGINGNNGGTGSTTLGERNALRQAQNYLRVMAFSREGLIDQLQYEGYSLSESTYAVNNCGANWYEQAAKKAREYLNIMPFSKQELIEQLEYEKFTHEQAVYGVEAVGY